MPAEILIAYATRSGSTAEVAEAIGVSLREAGLSVDVQAMHLVGVDSLVGRKAVILGAPLYVGRFPDEFHKFFARHRDALAPMRPWCFVLGPTRKEPKDFEAARTQATKQLERYGWFHPIDLQIFGGKWDVNTLRFPFSLARKLHLIPASMNTATDIRDWTAIREWSEGIARQLKSAA